MGHRTGYMKAQTQMQVAEAELMLTLSSIDTIFQLFKIVLDSIRVDLQMLQRKLCSFNVNKVVFY
mgnify:CR=1 FL=1